MKLVLVLLFLLPVHSWARPTVLVSYFDPYGRAKVNNSETVAKLLVAKQDRAFDIALCKLETKFDVSLEQFRNCLNALPETPVLVISLGETGCDLKVELMGRNNDRTYGPDNAGVQRRNTPIVKDAPPAYGLTYPLAEMYCSLDSGQRKETVVSNNAGSFVCNNLAYQVAWFEPQLTFGFIHVPSHNCKDLDRKNERVVSSLLQMIDRGVDVVTQNPSLIRLPVMKPEFDRLRAEDHADKCVRSFWENARAFDEKKRWF